MINSDFKENNYLYIPNFIDSDVAKELAIEFKQAAIEENWDGDGQAPNSYSKYNFISFLELLCEKTPQVSNFLGEKVLPTYTYARVYKEGSTLTRHIDRPACEISLTIHLDGDADWPIFIQKPNGEEVALNLRSGDAMMYLGCEADHWREQFEGKEYVQVFLHYVKSRGKNSFAYFDKTKEKPIDKKLVDIPKNELKPNMPKNINDYIVEFENILYDDLIDAIFREYENADDWHDSLVGPGVVDKNIRNVSTIGLSFEACINKNPAIRKLIDTELFNCAGEAIKKYNELFPFAQIETDSGYELLRYNPDQFYIQHTDSFKARPRAVSCSFMLNDDYEGGEFAFFNRELKFKPKRGSVLMFPSNFMYPHEIMPVTKGTRYSIITWFI